MSRLARYHARRDFARTPEPSAGGTASRLALRYSVQKHAATRLHFDLRLEWDGALLSWAVTRGPSLDPADKRLAVRTEDHPLSYLTFEGTIPKGNYGAGTVMLWDIGWWQPLADVRKGLKDGKLHFALHGRRATGNWKLVRMKGRKPGDRGRENWLLIKENDEAADPGRDLVAAYEASAGTGRSMQAIADDAPPTAFGPTRSRAAPRFLKPQLATRTADPPSGDAWWHELKLDGYRALVAVGKGGPRIYTRSGHDWSDRFAPLLPAFEELPARTALIDGEIAAGAGLHGFAALQRAIEAGGPFRFYAFDLLHLDGRSLAGRPLAERRRALEKLFEAAPPLGPLELSPVFDEDAETVLRTICKAGGEGLIAKLRSAPYRSGRSTAWLKVKCGHGDEFVICGYQRSDKRGRKFASLLLATREGEDFVYRGKVGTGFDADTQAALAERMTALERKTPPLADPPGGLRNIQWLTPALVAEIRYTEITTDGRLRHASFVGLREDKPAREVRLDDRPADGGKGRPQVAGIGISNGDRAIFPKPLLTKLELAEYYETVANRMLVAAADRPLALLRLPEGLDGPTFFQKHAGKGFPDAIRTVEIREKDGDTADYMAVDSAAGLVGAVQMGTIEFHIWGARRDRLEQPDRMVFDLDPDEGMRFSTVRKAAADLAADLRELGFESWPLVTGGKGIHIVVPLRRSAGWETVKLFARTFATMQADRAPRRFTASLSKASRKGRIFIDWLRNERGATAIAPFSVRARPGAPVAVPVTWDELAELPRANVFAPADALARSWDDTEVPSSARGITEAAVKRLSEFAGG